MAETHATKIRRATIEDLEAITVLVHNFVHEDNFEECLKGWDVERAQDVIEFFLENPDGAVFLLVKKGLIVGVLIGYIEQAFFSHVRIAKEIVWYVHGDYRGSMSSFRLIKAYEEWAKRLGASCILLSSLTNVGSLGKAYNRVGYNLFEQSFLKELN